MRRSAGWPFRAWGIVGAAMALAAGCNGPAAGPGDGRPAAPKAAAKAVATSQRLTGRLEGPAAGLLSDMAAGLLSDQGSGLITDNGAGLVANNGAGVVSSNAGRYAVRALDGLVRPVAGARVEPVDRAGSPLAGAATTGADGSWTLAGTWPAGGVAGVRARYTQEGHEVTLEALVDPVEGATAIDPATTLVARKLRATGAPTPAAAALAALVRATREALDRRAVVAAAVLSDKPAAQALDALAAGSPPLAAALAAAAPAATATAQPSPSPTPKPTPRAYVVAKFLGDQAAWKPAAIAPHGVAFDPDGGMWATEAAGHRLLKVASDGKATIMAGTGAAGFANGPGASAKLNGPHGLVAIGGGQVFVADEMNHRIRSLQPNGRLETLAGDGRAAFADGPAARASFNGPTGLARSGSDLLGNPIFVADTGNQRIRRIKDDGTVSTLAGDGVAGYQDGPAASARFQAPTGLALGPDGALYVGDVGNHRIRRVTMDGEVSTFAGDGRNAWQDGPRLAASFAAPRGLAFDVAGDLWVADAANHRIRVIRRDGTVETVAGDGRETYLDGPGPAASFNGLFGIAVGRDGRVFVAEQDNHCVRLIQW